MKTSEMKTELPVTGEPCPSLAFGRDSRQAGGWGGFIVNRKRKV